MGYLEKSYHQILGVHCILYISRVYFHQLQRRRCLCKAGTIMGPTQILVVLHIGHVQGLFFSHLLHVLLSIVACLAGNFWTIRVGFPWSRSVRVCPIGYCGRLYQRPLVGPDIFLSLVCYFAVQWVDFLLFLLLLGPNEFSRICDFCLECSSILHYGSALYKKSLTFT